MTPGAALSSLSPEQYKILLVVGEVYRQQICLHKNKKQSTDERIFSINIYQDFQLLAIDSNHQQIL